jgi:hypothetical protein
VNLVVIRACVVTGVWDGESVERPNMLAPEIRCFEGSKHFCTCERAMFRIKLANEWVNWTTGRAILALTQP